MTKQIQSFIMSSKKQFKMFSKSNLRHFLFACLVFLISMNDSFCQYTDCTIDKIISETKKDYPLNDILANGKIYQSQHMNSIGSPFYLSNKPIIADIYIKGKKITNKKILYSLTPEQIIIQERIPSKGEVFIILNKVMIDSFRIDNHLFIKKQWKNKLFLEYLVRGKHDIFSAHNKTQKTVIKQGKQLWQFYDKKPNFLIKDKYGLHDITSKRKLFKYFKSQKNKIKKFLKKNKIKYNKSSLEEKIQIFHFLNQFEIKK